MTRKTLILTDALFVIVCAAIYNNGDLKKYPVILVPCVIAAFATCVIRHINHYHMTKRFY